MWRHVYAAVPRGGDSVITRIEIDGYKSFDDFALDLPPFTVLVGANASGKSNLLEAVDLLGQLIREPTSQTLVDHARRGGPKELFRRGPDGVPVGAMRIAAHVLVHGYAGYCHLRVEARVTYADPPDPLRVDTDVLNVHDHYGYDPDRIPPPLPDLNLGETGQLHCTEVPVQDAAYRRELAETSGNWRILEPSPKAMRVVSSTYDTAPLAEDGKNLGAVLGRIARGPEAWYDFRADAVALLPISWTSRWRPTRSGVSGTSGFSTGTSTACLLARRRRAPCASWLCSPPLTIPPTKGSF